MNFFEELDGSQQLIPVGVVGLYAIHQDGVGEVIGVDLEHPRHLLVVLPGYVHSVALHARIQERVERDPVGCDAHALHLLEQSDGIIESLLAATPLDESVVGDFIQLDGG